MTKDDLPAGAKDKLIQTKQQWARDGRLLTGQSGAARLPPGQRKVKEWPVLDLGVQPSIAQQDWRLTVEGLVQKPLRWTLRDFLAQPQVNLISDIHCVTAWSRHDNNWEGVGALHLLTLVQPKPDAKFVIFESYDGYTTNVPIEVFAAPDALLAHSWEGEPLTTRHGGPVRVVIPKRYFWKSAKWVRAVQFVAVDKPGFWEVRGYHNDGDPWKEQRYD
ncbi:MAG: sulfite oxidase-like oxidoreductase [Alphaproteobacteria bacterium]|nr:sulfite oxidase-like oxidoreductase [Alphaproteobacteria bacterium]